MSNLEKNILNNWKSIVKEDSLGSRYQQRINSLKQQIIELEKSCAVLEEKLRKQERTEQVLLATKLRLKKLLNSSPCVIYSRQAEGNFGITFISNSIKQFGYQAQEFLQDEESWKQYIHPADLQTVAEQLLSSMTFKNRTSEYRLLQKDGSYCWIQDQCEVVYDDNGEAIEIIGSWQNIHQRKKLEAELHRAY